MKWCINLPGVMGAASSDRNKTSEVLGQENLTMPDRGRCSWGLGIALAFGIGGAITYSCDRTLAQITPDATLGTESSVITPNANVRGFPAELIEGGATRGANLFHSFQEFNVGNAQRVYFANPAGIENILSRVTSDNLSNILGTLGVDGGANLFLLNPNGIIFGQNAKLDIAGSFVVSTANSVVFNNGYQFSAKNPEAPPLLTVSVPLGVQYGTTQPKATIANSGNLAVGQNLTLSAGNLDLQGQLQAGSDLTLQAQDTVKVRDSATSPFIASSGGNLLVQGNQGLDIFALNHPNSGLFSSGNMVLRSANTVGGDAHYWSGGSFRIEKLDGSLGDLYSPNDPIIRSLGDVSFNAYQGTSLHILAGGEVNIGTVVITGAETGAAGVDYLQETVPLSNGREISINGRLQPTLDIRAGVAPAFIGVPGVTGVNFPRDRFFGQGSLTDASTSADITIGDVQMVPPNGLVFITNQYQPNTALPGGDITVTGAGVFGKGIDSRGFGGNGSSVILDSRRNIEITNSGIDSSSTSNAGNAGDITLLANETVSLKNSNVFSQTLGAGEGGDINIQARQLLVADGAQVSATTLGEGKGGSLIINASQSLQVIGTTPDGQFGSGLFAQTTGKGDGGNVEITTPVLLVKDGAQVNVSTYGEGKGGSLIVNASQAVQIIGTTPDGQFHTGLAAQASGTGDGGNVEITTPQLLVKDGALVSVSTLGEGKGGSLIVNASELVQLMGTAADGQFPSLLTAQTTGKGDGGNVEITTPVLLVKDGAQVNVSTFGEGKGGNLIVNAPQAVQLMGTTPNGQFNGGLFAQTTGKGDGGNVEITTPSLLVTDGASVSVSAFNAGKGGSLIVNASESVQLIGTSADGQLNSGLDAQTQGTGDGGNMTITTPVLLVKDGAQVDVSNYGEGKGGSLIINASELVQLMGTSADGQFVSGLFAETYGKREGGNVEITTPWLLVTDGAAVNVSTRGEGKGGSLIVNASELVQLMGTSADGQFVSGLAALTQGTGDAGNVEITTPWLLVTDGARVNISTRGEGNGGSLRVNASQAVQILGTSVDGQFGSALFAITDGKGDGGNVEITTPWLLITDGAAVSASTYGEGNGGSLIVNASQAVQLMGASANDQFRSGLFAFTTGKGDAGNVEITTPWLLVTDGAVVNVSTRGEGRGGSLIVNASQAVQLMGIPADGQVGGGLYALTEATGNGGNVQITTPWLLVTDGALVNVSTRGEGNGGNLIINASEQIQLSGTGGLFVNASAGGTAGDLTVKTNAMSVSNGAQVTVSSPQGQAGNLNITANSLTLNQGTLSAETAKSDAAEGGANITLSGLEFLRMDNESLISASALGNANGGNVTIDSTLIVATPPTGPEGSDIIANAEQGNGGRVNVTTQGLFGIEFRPQRTPKNDITVSSTFGLSGEYILNTPGIDPSRGLTELPTNVVDATEQIDRRCTPAGRTQERSSFTITGRGGLPPSPNDPLQGESVITNWVSLDSDVETNTPPATTIPKSSASRQLVEAQGWYFNEKGEVVLTASAPKVTPQGEWLSPPECNPYKSQKLKVKSQKSF